MKKLLILMLVLGMSSLASATITAVAPDSIEVGVTDIISVSSDSTADGGIYLDIYYLSDSSYTLSNLTLTSLAPSLSSFSWYTASYDNDEIEILFASAPEEVVTTGVWFTLDITCDAMVDVLVEVYDSASPYPLLQTMTIEQVPEPMTIALLGLGSLFLLRRRK